LPALRRGDRQVAHPSAVLERSDLRVAAQIADQDDLVDATSHGILEPQLPAAAEPAAGMPHYAQSGSAAKARQGWAAATRVAFCSHPLHILDWCRTAELPPSRDASSIDRRAVRAD